VFVAGGVEGVFLAGVLGACVPPAPAPARAAPVAPLAPVEGGM
jgi:hypothetical protein